MLGVESGGWLLSAASDGPVSLAANLEREQGKVPLLGGCCGPSRSWGFMPHVMRGYQGLFQA